MSQRQRTFGNSIALAAALAALCGSAGLSTALGQTVTPIPSVASTNPKRDALLRLMKPVDIEFKDNRLEDVVRVLNDLTGVEFEPAWLDDQNTVGLDKEKLVTLRSKGATALKLLERVLEKTAEEGATGGNTWQLTETGSVQIGPKSRLNRDKRVEIYDINDLLFVTPDFDNAPEFDLQSTLQSSGQGGGGSSQSPFRQNNQNQQDDNTVPREQRAQAIIDLILELVETEQWANNGGENGPTIRYYQGSVIVNGPDYIHRQLNGYPFWPSSRTNVSMVGGRRYVSLTGSVTNSQLDGFAEQPVTGVVGGSPGGGG